MQVKISLSPEFKDPLAEIHTESVTEEVQNAVSLLQTEPSLITAQIDNRIAVLRPEEIYMVRVEGGDTILYGKAQTYYSRKRLYEIAERLGPGFLQIAKSTLVNLSYLDSVEAGFNGTLLLRLKNGCKDYVSRKYLPAFKQHLGL